MKLTKKLAVLADAAKYDASCASSGAGGRTSRSGGIGSTTGTGICHSYTPDGRCVSLLKILLTNVCIFDCVYCVNRRSSDVQRARFTVQEIVDLTLDFYRRNYIEGLFLSSGIIRSPDYTMEQLVAVARDLRETHGFRGYIHLKTIPEADPALLEEAGRWADRVSINVELPSQAGLDRLAPEKTLVQIESAMSRTRGRIDEARSARSGTRPARGAPRFAPGGQSTQMIVGATEATDSDVLGTASRLYRAHRLRRVYYSAFSPIPASSDRLPLAPPPLLREHRLYQADWLLRFYGFDVQEIVPSSHPDLRLEIDPKLSWALRHPDAFPVDVNTADREALLRVPGIGVRNAKRILSSRRHRRIRYEDLVRLSVRTKTARYFIITADYRPRELNPMRAEAELTPSAFQMDLFHTHSSTSSSPDSRPRRSQAPTSQREADFSSTLQIEAAASLSGEF